MQHSICNGCGRTGSASAHMWERAAILQQVTHHKGASPTVFLGVQSYLA